MNNEYLQEVEAMVDLDVLTTDGFAMYALTLTGLREMTSEELQTAAKMADRYFAEDLFPTWLAEGDDGLEEVVTCDDWHAVADGYMAALLHRLDELEPMYMVFEAQKDAVIAACDGHDRLAHLANLAWVPAMWGLASAITDPAESRNAAIQVLTGPFAQIMSDTMLAREAQS